MVDHACELASYWHALIGVYVNDYTQIISISHPFKYYCAGGEAMLNDREQTAICSFF